MNDETKPSREPVAVGSDSNDGLGGDRWDESISETRDRIKSKTRGLPQTPELLKANALFARLPLYLQSQIDEQEDEACDA